MRRVTRLAAVLIASAAPLWAASPRKRPIEYVVFPDEGHGFTKKKNQIEGWSAILKFLDRYLKGSPAPPAPAGG